MEPRVQALLSRLLDDEREIEEASQDVFVQAWRNLDRFRGESAVFTWLYRIAVNEALQRLRRRRLQVVELDEAEVGASAERGPGEAAAGAELRAFLLAHIRHLPPEYRVPLVLRDIEGFSNDEVEPRWGSRSPRRRAGAALLDGLGIDFGVLASN